ncbi:MAG: type II toxin-antitoxin system VapC family toxin [Mycobacteriales bacterium]
MDTSAVIELPTQGSDVEASAEYFISSITIAELNAGIHTTGDPIERARRLARLQWADAVDPLPYTRSTARLYGQPYAAVLAHGRNPRPRRIDLLVASVAATHRFPLVTRNPKDFAGLAPLVTLVGL